MSATVTMRIGGTEIPLDGVTWKQMSVQGEDPHARPLSVMSFSCELTASAEKDWKRAWDEMRKETAPQHTLTFTRKLRDGSTITEEIEVDRINVVLARRGLKRPGRWTDATRERRHKRLVRAAQRRAGISRRGLVRGLIRLSDCETASAAYWLVGMLPPVFPFASVGSIGVVLPSEEEEPSS